MAYISKIKLKNFKKFEEYEVEFDRERNILIGDNEAGKSSILTAIELVLSGSRNKVESLGIEALFNTQAVNKFNNSNKTITDLPTISIELFLEDIINPDLNGKCNSDAVNNNGIRLICEPNDDLLNEINQVLTSSGNTDNFPFEFYIAKFTTFSGETFSSYRKFLHSLLIDNTQINSEYAHNQYVKAMYEAISTPADRNTLKNKYRKQKTEFTNQELSYINNGISDYSFAIRSSSKSNLETDLIIAEDNIPIENKGKGQQCFIKTSFALNGRGKEKDIDILLLEEPENHLSHTNMNKLISLIEQSHKNQMIIATHSSLISSRLDLRKAILLNSSANKPTTLAELTSNTAKFFIKAPNHNILELVLSKKVILVEGDAEYILMEALYKKITGSIPADKGVHIISVGGTSFKRYMEVSKLLNIKTAVIRDNDKDYQKNCVNNYINHIDEHIQVFADKDETRYTFEICLYEDNKDICNDLFFSSRRRLSIDEYMLDNKTIVALELLEFFEKNELNVPDYIVEAIRWINE